MSANVFGSGGLTSLATPLQCASVAASLLEQGAYGTGVDGDDGIVVVGFQEAFGFKTGFLTYLIQVLVITAGSILRLFDRWLEARRIIRTTMESDAGGRDDAALLQADGNAEGRVEHMEAGQPLPPPSPPPLEPPAPERLLAPVHFAWRLLRTLYIVVAHVLVIGINTIVMYPLNGCLRFRRGVPHLLCDSKPHIIARFAHCCGVDWHAVGYDCTATRDGSLSMPRGDRNSRTTDGGLLLMANAAPNDSGWTAFDAMNGSESFCNKGFMWAFFAYADADVVGAGGAAEAQPGVLVVNTHMQASDDPLRGIIGAKNAHRVQVAQLRAFLDRWRRGGVREIWLLGDFNCADGAWLEQELNCRKVSSTEPTHADGNVDHVLYWNAERSKMSIAVDCRVTLEDSESDHKMLLCSVPSRTGGARSPRGQAAAAAPSQVSLALHALKWRLSFG